MITISDGILTIPEGERFVGFSGDNLHTQKKFLIRSDTQSGWLYRLYLTFDDGRHNFFVLPATVGSEGTWLVWNIEESHILKSGIVKAQIKAFSNEKEVYHTTSDVFVAGKATEEDEEFKNSNSEFLLYEKTLNELYRKMQNASAKMPYVGTNGNWFTYDINSENYVDSGVSSLVSLGDGTLPPSKLDRAYWEKKISLHRQIKDCALLFDLVDTVNGTGSIAFVYLKLYVASLDTHIEGYCYAVGVTTDSADEVYLVNVTDGSSWKIRRVNEGDEVTPVYRFSYFNNLIDTDAIKDGAITEDKLYNSFWRRFEAIPTASNDTFLSSLLSDEVLALIKLDTSTYSNMGEGPFAAIPLGDGRYTLINLTTAEMWIVLKENEALTFALIYSPVAVDGELSPTSKNPVQNRLVSTELNKRLKTVVLTAMSDDYDATGHLTDGNYVGLVRGANENILSYKFESWYEYSTITQIRTFLSTGKRQCRKGTLSNNVYTWGAWENLDTASGNTEQSFVYLKGFNSVEELQNYNFETDKVYYFLSTAQLGSIIGSGYCFSRYYLKTDPQTDEVVSKMLEIINYSTLTVWRFNITDGTAEFVLTAKADTDYNPESENPQSGKAVAQVVGDIDSALDGILAIQSSLIGGESL